MKLPSFSRFSGVVLVVLLAVSVACRKQLSDPFPDMDPKPTVNALLRAGEPIGLHLSWAGKIDTMPLESINEAEVQLFNGTTYLETLESRGEGLFEARTIAEIGATYSFRLVIPSFPEICCSARVPERQRILDIRHRNNVGKDRDGLSCPGMEVKISCNPGAREYFYLHVTMPELGRIELVDLMDPVLQSEGMPLLLFSNRLIGDSSYTLRFTYTTGRAQSTGTEGFVMTLFPLVLELRSIDSAYYHYLRSQYLYDKGLYESYLGEIYPPFPLFTNVPGAYGLVGAFSKYVSDTVFPNR